MENTDFKVITHMTVYIDDIVSNTPPYVYAKRGDASSRALIIEIRSSKGQVKISTSARVNAILPSNKEYYAEAVINSDGSIYVDIPPEFLVEEGRVSCDIMVRDSDGNNYISTSPFYIIVGRSNYSAYAEEGSDYTIRIATLEEVKEYLEI